MPAGEIQLVAYGEENIVLSDKPQITFFKIIYRRYTNFSIETIQNNFLYQIKFGKKYSLEIEKLGDLLHKMWLIIELPNIPIVYDINNEIDNKLKFKWAQKIAYAIIDYVEIEIGGQTIQKQWGEWMNVLNEFNWNNYNSSLDEYIGNVPELTTYSYLKNGVNSYVLHIPLFFWFCNTSGLALPLLCLEYSIVRFNIQLNDYQNCAIYSPSNYIIITQYYGQPVLGEPIIQVSNQGIAWGEFDSIEVDTYDPVTLEPLTYKLFYRKISDNEFISTSIDYYSNISINFSNSGLQNYFIYALNSLAIFIPTPSQLNDPSSIYIQRNYPYIIPTDVTITSMYLLCDYIFLDREERTKFYQNKHTYLIEQVYFSNPSFLFNQFNRNTVDIINPCKYFVFMGQVKYFLNQNVNYLFNYNTLFFDTKLTNNVNLPFTNKPVIKTAYYSFNSNPVSQNFDMSYYTNLNTFLSFPMCYDTKGIGLATFALYPDNLQPSGTMNMSSINLFSIDTYFNPIDIDYNNYVFKSYSLTYNYLKIANGVCATIFASNF